MLFGMIGAGTVSQAIASHALKAGHKVVFSNSQGPDTLAGLVGRLGLGASAGTVAEVGDGPLSGLHAIREDATAK